LAPSKILRHRKCSFPYNDPTDLDHLLDGLEVTTWLKNDKDLKSISVIAAAFGERERGVKGGSGPMGPWN
jgi:hypothetical protein